MPQPHQLSSSWVSAHTPWPPSLPVPGCTLCLAPSGHQQACTHAPLGHTATCHFPCSKQFPAVPPPPPHPVCCRLNDASCCVRPSGGPQASSSLPRSWAGAHCPSQYPAHAHPSTQTPPVMQQIQECTPQLPNIFQREDETDTLDRTSTAGRWSPTFNIQGPAWARPGVRGGREETRTQTWP